MICCCVGRRGRGRGCIGQTTITTTTTAVSIDIINSRLETHVEIAHRRLGLDLIENVLAYESRKDLDKMRENVHTDLVHLVVAQTQTEFDDVEKTVLEQRLEKLITSLLQTMKKTRVLAQKLQHFTTFVRVKIWLF